MPRTQRKQKAKSVRTYAITAGLSILFLVLLWAVFGIAIKEERARHAVEARKAELAVLEERKAVFEQNVEELASARGQEATLRQNHGVARAGEEVIIVVPPKADELGPKLPWYTRFLGWFGIW